MPSTKYFWQAKNTATQGIMAVGVLLGKFVPAIPAFITKFEVFGINIIIGILLWVMPRPAETISSLGISRLSRPKSS